VKNLAVGYKMQSTQLQWASAIPKPYPAILATQ